MIGVWKTKRIKTLVKTGSLSSARHTEIKGPVLFFWAVPHAAEHKGAGATAQAAQ